MKDHRLKLRKLAHGPRWKISLFSLVINVLLFRQCCIDYYFYLNSTFLRARRAFTKRKILRAHWLGAQIHKPHRLAFIVLGIVLLAGTILAPGLLGMLYWVIGWGSLFSIFVTTKSIALIIQRIRL